MRAAIQNPPRPNKRQESKLNSGLNSRPKSLYIKIHQLRPRLGDKTFQLRFCTRVRGHRRASDTYVGYILSSSDTSQMPAGCQPDTKRQCIAAHTPRQCPKKPPYRTKPTRPLHLHSHDGVASARDRHLHQLLISNAFHDRQLHRHIRQCQSVSMSVNLN